MKKQKLVLTTQSTINIDIALQSKKWASKVVKAMNRAIELCVKTPDKDNDLF